MRADNLLCLRQRKFLLTTDSQHGLPIYPNVAEEMVLTGIDQLWVADITYIRLQVEFVYLAVLLDAFSRRCLGWALRRSLEAVLVLEALRMALMRRHPRPGLVHHSDRGVQYASRDYTALLQQHGIRISMSRLATPYDNAQAESFIKTLMYEEIYRSDVGLGEAMNGNGCLRSPHSSAAMSFQSAIPQQVALQQCLPLLHRLQTILNNQCCRTMILQRTASTPLTPCLSSRVHSSG